MLHEEFQWIYLQDDVKLLLLTANSRLLFEIKIVHDLSCHPIFPMAAVYITAKFHSSTSIDSWVIAVCAKIQDGGILNHNFVMLDHPWSPFVHLKFPSKFRVDRVRTFEDIAIRKFCKSGLKCLFRPPNHVFWGVLTPKHYFYHQNPQKALPYVETRILSHKWSWSVFWCDLEVRARIQKQERTQVTENALLAQTPFPLSPINQILHVGSYHGYLSCFKVSSRLAENVGAVGGLKFQSSHWLGTSVIQQLVATAQAVMWNPVTTN